MSNQTGLIKCNHQAILRRLPKAEYDCIDYCEHCVDNHDKVVSMAYEKDSFGWVMIYAQSQECTDKSETEAAEEIMHCNDCQHPFPRKDVKLWRWYDFNAADGDEPLVVCKECQTREKHLERVQRDDAAYRDEFDLDE